MKNVVMGTAGHIDHGKTSLVKRLTGIDTDRLAEEKKRGMTIELGFAPLTLPSGNTISIIDVPGHEKFIKTMVAGVQGIDFVMLVVAADEGVMPQTREHIEILSLLNINKGVVALTKSDLAEEEWLEMVEDEVRKVLEGTALNGIPIIRVSSVSGSGIGLLTVELEKLAAKAAQNEGGELFRLYVDRVFTMTGYGTVVTGTVSGGKINKGHVVEILPSGKTARVRGIQVHNKSAGEAGSGDRCALNLSGIEKEEIERGDVITEHGMITPSIVADAVLQAVSGKEGIYHNQRVHFHSGTKVVLARVRILGTDRIPGGEKGYVQLRFEEPVPIIRGDSFVIRSYSPVNTIGGGRVIYHNSINRRRFSEEAIEDFRTGEKQDIKDVASYIIKNYKRIFNVDDLWREFFHGKDNLIEILREECENGEVIRLETNKFLSRGLYYLYIEKINNEFSQLYKKYPYRYMIDREEINSRIFGYMDTKDFSALIKKMYEDGLISVEGNNIVQAGGLAQKGIFAMKPVREMEKRYLENIAVSGIQGITPFDAEEIERFLIHERRIVDIGYGILVHIDILNNYIKNIRQILSEQGSATTAEIRDKMEIGRKLTIALLEYLDEKGVTQRVGDIRKPGAQF